MSRQLISDFALNDAIYGFLKSAAAIEPIQRNPSNLDETAKLPHSWNRKPPILLTITLTTISVDLW